ncbi:MAG: hypothetical protein KGJ13_05045 [Patescibacteria group bacterium]|nr:hypothetical protein [Patescibacteria group bacterium]
MSNPNMQPRPGPLASQAVPKVQYVEDFFIYEIDASALAAGGVFNGNIQILADSDFRWTKFAGFADIAGAAQTDSGRVIPLVTVNIVDTGSGRNLMSSAVPWGAYIGSGTLPFILPVPRIFKARTNIAVTMTNYSAATTYNLRLSFIGSKIFQLG